MSAAAVTLAAQGHIGIGVGMVSNTALSDMTVGELYEQCVRVNVDPCETLVRVLTGIEQAPDFLSRLFGTDIESADDRGEVA